MRILVVVPSFGRPDRLATCLDGCLCLSRQPDGIAVVARVGDVRTINLAEARGVQVILVTTPGHLPPIDAALQDLDCDLMAVIDDDAVPRPDWLEQVEAWFADPGVVAIGGPVQNHPPAPSTRLPARPGKVTWYGGFSRNAVVDEVSEPYRPDFLSGGNVAYRTSALKRVGIDLALNGGAAIHYEADLGLGLARWGRLVFDPSMVVDHYPGLRAGAPPRTSVRAYVLEGTHNLYYIAAKHYGWLRRAVFLVVMEVWGQRFSPGILRSRRIALDSGCSPEELRDELRVVRRDAWHAGRISGRARRV